MSIYTELLKYKEQYNDIIYYESVNKKEQARYSYIFRYLNYNEYLAALKLISSEDQSIIEEMYNDIFNRCLLYTNNDNINKSIKINLGELIYTKSTITIEDFMKIRKEIEKNLTFADVFFSVIIQAMPSYRLEDLYKLPKSIIYRLLIIAFNLLNTNPEKLWGKQSKHINNVRQYPAQQVQSNNNEIFQQTELAARQALEQSKQNPKKFINWEEENQELNKFWEG